jgi:hypothetical protein
VTVAEWCKSNSTSDGTSIEKWSHEMSPPTAPLATDETNRRSLKRVLLYKAIIGEAEEYKKKLDAGTIPHGIVGSSGSEPESEWDWENHMVCVCAA